MKVKFERMVLRDEKRLGWLLKSNLFNRARLIEIILFSIVGSTAMVIHYGVFYVLLPFLPVNVAFSVGYLISFLYNFTMTSHITFQVKPSMGRLLRFAASHGTNYLLQILLLNFFIHVIDLNEKIAPVPVYIISVPISYMLVRMAMKSKL